MPKSREQTDMEKYADSLPNGTVKSDLKRMEREIEVAYQCLEQYRKYAGDPKAKPTLKQMEDYLKKEDPDSYERLMDRRGTLNALKDLIEIEAEKKKKYDRFTEPKKFEGFSHRTLKEDMHNPPSFGKLGKKLDRE